MEAGDFREFEVCLYASLCNANALTVSRAEVMTAFLENIDEKYGTIEECVKVLFEFDDEEIQTIKANLAP